MRQQTGDLRRVFLSAGEASGDAYAAALVKEMRSILIAKNHAVPRFEGFGGEKSTAAGVDLFADTTSWGAIGVGQALRRYPEVVGHYYRLKRHMRATEPGLLVPIDFGYLNIRLARHARRQGWRVVYWMPPGSWRKDRQGKHLGLVSNAIVTPFEWSAEILNSTGARAFWFGHPLKQILGSSSIGYRSSGNGTSLAILPGSRSHELDANLPLLAQVLEGWNGQAEFALAPGVDSEEIEDRWKALTARTDRFTLADTAAVLRRARAGLICSGTATLEAAICRCPMVVFYELTPMMRREARLRRASRPKFIALPNILLDRQVVPEHVEGTGIDPKPLRKELEDIWADGEVRSAQLAAFEELDELLGPGDGVTRAAEIAVSLLSSARLPSRASVLV